MIDDVHTYPVNDVVAHELEGTDCVCGPDLERIEGCWHVVHHSLDGREFHEND